MKKVSKRVLSLIMAVAMMLGMIMAAPMSGVKAATQANPGEKLVFNKLYTGELDERGLGIGSDSYYGFDFTLNTSGAVKLNVDVSGLPALGFMRFSIFDSDGTRVWHQDVSNGIIDIGADLLAGSYFLKAEQPTSGLQNTFKFTAKFEDAKETYSESIDKRNDTIETANAYTVGKTVNGQIAQNDKNDYYSFSVKKNAFVTYNVNSNFYHAFYIYDKNGNVLEYVSNVDVGKQAITFFLPKGKYYLNVAQSGYAGTYSFKLTAKKMPTGKITKIKKRIGGLQVRLSKVSGIDGYEIEVSRKKKFKGATKQQLSAEYRRTNIFNLKNKKTYYIRVRTYCIDKKTGKKYYSDWSKAKKVKTK